MIMIMIVIVIIIMIKFFIHMAFITSGAFQKGSVSIGNLGELRYM